MQTHYIVSLYGTTNSNYKTMTVQIVEKKKNGIIHKKNIYKPNKNNEINILTIQQGKRSQPQGQ